LALEPARTPFRRPRVTVFSPLRPWPVWACRRARSRGREPPGATRRPPARRWAASSASGLRAGRRRDGRSVPPASKSCSRTPSAPRRNGLAMGPTAQRMPKAGRPRFAMPSSATASSRTPRSRLSRKHEGRAL